MTATLHDQLAAESAEMEQRVRAAERKAVQAETLLRHVEQAAKEREQALQALRQQDARSSITTLTTALVQALTTYIAVAKDPPRARQIVQNFLSTQLIPIVGPIPDAPWGSGELE